MARVLIIEDDKILNDAYAVILEKAGHDVQTALNGREGLAKAEAAEPDIILLDLLMPEMDGLEFLRAYDAKTKHPDVKIVILSNLGDEKKIEEGIGLGAYKYIIKAHASPEELSALVNRLIERNLAK